MQVDVWEVDRDKGESRIMRQHESTIVTSFHGAFYLDWALQVALALTRLGRIIFGHD